VNSVKPEPRPVSRWTNLAPELLASLRKEREQVSKHDTGHNKIDDPHFDPDHDRRLVLFDLPIGAFYQGGG